MFLRWFHTVAILFTHNSITVVIFFLYSNIKIAIQLCGFTRRQRGGEILCDFIFRWIFIWHSAFIPLLLSLSFVQYFWCVLQNAHTIFSSKQNRKQKKQQKRQRKQIKFGNAEMHSVNRINSAKKFCVALAYSWTVT